MDAKDYRPVYDETEVQKYLDASQADGYSKITTKIDSKYCLMLPSARVLATLFSPPPVIFMSQPNRQAAGSPFAATFDHFVPWFRFADGVERNAGQLAIYWGMAGVPYQDALGYAESDVKTEVEGQ